jgi:hypothetical protein
MKPCVSAPRSPARCGVLSRTRISLIRVLRASLPRAADRTAEPKHHLEPSSAVDRSSQPPDHTFVAERYFTVEEANALLATVRPLAEEMVAHRRALNEALERQERIEGKVQTNGGGISHDAPAELAAQVDAEAEAVARCLDAIHGLGAVVKDLDAGLVDFPALREGEEVLLCWRLGEDEIRYWHGLQDGFAGRKELPL